LRFGLNVLSFNKGFPQSPISGNFVQRFSAQPERKKGVIFGAGFHEKEAIVGKKKKKASPFSKRVSEALSSPPLKLNLTPQINRGKNNPPPVPWSKILIASQEGPKTCQMKERKRSAHYLLPTPFTVLENPKGLPDFFKLPLQFPKIMAKPFWILNQNH
jgi:hypothetical protein